MKVVKQDKNGATIELTTDELGMIGLVGTEFTQGAYAPTEEQWNHLMPRSRESVIELFEALP